MTLRYSTKENNDICKDFILDYCKIAPTDDSFRLLIEVRMHYFIGVSNIANPKVIDSTHCFNILKSCFFSSFKSFIIFAESTNNKILLELFLVLLIDYFYKDRKYDKLNILAKFIHKKDFLKAEKQICRCIMNLRKRKNSHDLDYALYNNIYTLLIFNKHHKLISQKINEKYPLINDTYLKSKIINNISCF